MVVLMIPFLTLLERKVLRYIQLRKGPKKVGVLGILQPIRDGVKLVLKESGTIVTANKFIFWLSPLLKFLLMLILFLLFSPIFPVYSVKLGLLGYLCISSLLVYTVLFAGWRRNSKYSFLGSLRGAAQIISYEIVILTLIFFPLLTKWTYNRIEVSRNKFSFSFILYLAIFPIWIIRIIAETNRSPFDFAEGERELVSGFKTEYRGFIFALLFLGEYGNIIFVSFLTRYFFFPSGFISKILFPILVVILILIFRGTFPRFRYDLLMRLAWVIMLPLVLGFFWVIFVLLKNGVFKHVRPLT